MTFDESVAAALDGTGRQRVNVLVKECGTAHTLIHYVDIHNLYGVIEWFDHAGTLVGTSAADDDIDDCDRLYGGTEWGEIPACEPGCVIQSIPYCGENGDECTPEDYVHIDDCGGGVPAG